MSDRDFQIGGREFKIGKLDPLKQFHIVRRLGPILSDIIPVAQKIKGALAVKEQTEEQKFETIALLAQPILTGLSKLSDEDANKVLIGLLNAIEVKQMPVGNWARVARDEMLMIQDLDFQMMLQAAGRSFAYNLAGFFNVAQQVSHGGK